MNASLKHGLSIFGSMLVGMAVMVLAGGYAFYNGDIAIVKKESLEFTRTSSLIGTKPAQCHITRYRTFEGEHAVLDAKHHSGYSGTSAFAVQQTVWGDRVTVSSLRAADQHSFYASHAVNSPQDKEQDLLWTCATELKFMF